jgi:subtilase family serine protease
MKAQDPYGVGVPVTRGYWGAGSGYSDLFAKPDYQKLVNTGSSSMRAVPDIGMQVGGCPVGSKDFHHGACNGGNKPENGSGNTQRSSVVVAYGVGKGGGFYAFIGTSVSSPEFAGALAHLVEQKGRMGNVNPHLYQLAAKQATTSHRYFHTNIPGYNGVEQTDLNSTYSLSTGVGTPIVVNMINQPKAPRAGVPQTPSNP